MLSMLKNMFSSDESYQSISGAEARELISKNSKMQVVDARTLGELAEGKHPKAIHIDFLGGTFLTTAQKKLDPKLPVMIYCRSGNRSASACGLLSKNGFEEVYNVKGGFGQLRG